MKPLPDKGPATALVQVQDLKVHFPVRRGAVVARTVGHVRAVDGVTFTVNCGETVGLVGESGCGKSTLGRTLLRIHQPTAGSIRFDGEDIAPMRGEDLRRLARRCQMVFQDVAGSLDPRMRIGDTIGEPLLIHRVGDGRARKERVGDLMATVGLLPRYARLYPHQLSGGQRQRVGIARALALDPDFIVCDEAVSALDVSIQAQIINLLAELRERLGLTYLFIAHNLAVVRHLSSRIVVMYLGKVMEEGPSDAIVREPLHPYSRLLMASIAIADPERDAARRASLVEVDKDLPGPGNAPRGCRFSNRCPRAVDVQREWGIDCAVEEPAMASISGGRHVACHLYAPCRERMGSTP
jgi:oligopeptide transport system ATP-binding protein